MDQTRHIAKTLDHEFVGSKVAILFLRVFAICEEEGHVIMDYPFVPFHIKVGIVKHVEVTKCGENINGSITRLGTRNSCNLK